MITAALLQRQRQKARGLTSSNNTNTHSVKRGGEASQRAEVTDALILYLL
jgi:hypothetical protein